MTRTRVPISLCDKTFKTPALSSHKALKMTADFSTDLRDQLRRGSPMFSRFYVLRNTGLGSLPYIFTAVIAFQFHHCQHASSGASCESQSFGPIFVNIHPLWTQHGLSWTRCPGHDDQPREVTAESSVGQLSLYADSFSNRRRKPPKVKLF